MLINHKFLLRNTSSETKIFLQNVNTSQKSQTVLTEYKILIT